MKGIDLLINKLAAATPPPLLILKAHPESDDPQKDQELWQQLLLEGYLSRVKNVDKSHLHILLEQGLPDIVEIHVPENGKPYSLKNNDLKEFFSVQKFKNWELPSRIIIINRCDLIGEAYGNKMLKTLEEPRPGTLVILKNPTSKKLLTTIESRAIIMKTPLNKPTKQEVLQNSNEKFKAFLSELAQDNELQNLSKNLIENGIGLQKMANHLKSDHYAKEILLKALINVQAYSVNSWKQEDHFLDEIKWFQHSQLFHGLETERFYGLINAVFPQNSRQDSTSKAY